MVENKILGAEMLADVKRKKAEATILKSDLEEFTVDSTK